MSAPRRLLLVNASARGEGSVTRKLTTRLVAELDPDAVVERDLTRQPLPFVDEAWVEANFTAADARSVAQQGVLSGSDALVEELEAAQLLVFGVPMYNFGIPAAMKAWIDQITRVGRTFRYTAEGPVGLLKNKQAYVVIATGGTALGSEIDYASGYLQLLLGFVGIDDVTIINAQRGDADSALEQITALIADSRQA